MNNVTSKYNSVKTSKLTALQDIISKTTHDVVSKTDQDIISLAKKAEGVADDVAAIDNQLYGSIKLPADFDYTSELEQALKAKYSI